jgi:2-dehydro-3-deoxyphosphogluconate aldolase/(4S)-4-hydroxy-2-oxoglutarate aldolase
MHFMPTGGVTKDNLNDYLGFNKVFCCGGTWMVKKDMIAAGKFDKIEEMTRDAVNAMLGFKLKHVGINQSDASAAEAVADKFDNLFGFTKKVGNSSVFAGSFVEVMKAKGRGECGHIAIGCNNVDRAVYHLSKQGVKFDESSFAYDADNHLKVAYLADDFGGFAVHLGLN